MSISVTATIVEVQCGDCGTWFGLEETFMESRKRDGKSFYCPNGHFVGWGDSENKRLRRQLEQEQRSVASLRENMVAAQRGRDRAEKSLQRLKKRTAAGVCPCCSRTVSQLARHMESKHKEFLALNGLTPPKQLPEKVQ